MIDITYVAAWACSGFAGAWIGNLMFSRRKQKHLITRVDGWKKVSEEKIPSEFIDAKYSTTPILVSDGKVVEDLYSFSIRFNSQGQMCFSADGEIRPILYWAGWPEPPKFGEKR